MLKNSLLNSETEKKIDDLLSKMTVSEKIGQLTLVGPSPVGGFEISLEEQKKMLADGRITEEEYERAVNNIPLDKREDDVAVGKIGAFIGITGMDKTDRLQRIAVEKSRLGIPLLFGLDVIHGYNTVFPIPLAESCCWNEDIWEKTAAAAADEASSVGIKWTFAPMVDIARDARWGRIAEGAGEDPCLGSRCAEAKVRGFQGDDCSQFNKLLACAKHYVAYGAGVGGRDYNTVDMSLQQLYETYLPPFIAALNAGVATVMPSFNDFNGVPCTANKKLLSDVLKGELGFDGMVVSDANAVAECVNHGFAADRSDAAGKSLSAGCDMDMGSMCYFESIEALLKTGQITSEQLDDAVRRVLRIKFAAGLFDNPYSDKNRKTDFIDNYRSLARETAAKSAVLLKNSGALPLKKSDSIILTGKLADDNAEMLGTWAGRGKPEDVVTVKDAFLQNNTELEYYPCCGPKAHLNSDELMKAMSSKAEIAVAVVGESVEQSGEAASRSEIGISEEQVLMLESLHNSGKTVITVLCNGRPLELEKVLSYSDAVLELWHAGTEAGNAAYDILFGDVNPSGRLTVTFPNHSGECPMYYNHPSTGRPVSDFKFSCKYIDSPYIPRFPFGFGLSYTDYEYSYLRVSASEEFVTAEVIVKNIGKYAGIETIQVYIRDLVASRVRPVLELKDFKQVYLKPGEFKRVEFAIPVSALAFFDSDMNKVVEAGEFEIYIGHSSKENLCGKFTLQ